MRCPYCGEFLPDTASFCRSCMHRISPVLRLRNKSIVRLFLPHICLCFLLLMGIAGIWISKSFAAPGAMTSSVLSTGVKNEEASSSGLKEEDFPAIREPESSSQSLDKSSQPQLSSQAVSSQEVISQQMAGQVNSSESSRISSDSPSSQSPGVSQNNPEISIPPAPSLDRDALIAACRSQFDSWLTYSPAARFLPALFQWAGKQKRPLSSRRYCSPPYKRFLYRLEVGTKPPSWNPTHLLCMYKRKSGSRKSHPMQPGFLF